MFTTMAQKTITSFFTRSVADSKNSSSQQSTTKQNKKKSIKPEIPKLPDKSPKEDADSPIKVKQARKAARVIYSDDEEESPIRNSSPEPESQENAKKRKSRKVGSSGESAEEATPKKKIRTYGRSNSSRKIKPEKNESDDPEIKDDTDESQGEVEAKTNSPKKAHTESKTLHNFFVRKSNADSESSAKAASSSSSKPAARAKQDSSPKRRSHSPSPTKETKEKAKPDSSKTPRKKVLSDGAGSAESYDPTLKKYHPVDDACWKQGEKVPYLALAKTLEAIEAISARLKMIEILANFLRSVIVLTPDDLLYCIYLCLNQLAPSYEGLELGVGDMVLMKAISQTTGQSVEAIKSKMAMKGDLGTIAEAGRTNQRTMFQPPKLTVTGVYEKLREIALMSGNASMSKKIDKIKVMLVACRQCEARYLIRSLGGKLRIGLAEQSVLAAVAQAVTLTPPNQDYPLEIINTSQGMSSDAYNKKLQANILIIKTTYCECPSYDAIVHVLLEKGIDALPEHCKISPGIPIKPMLAHPTKGVQEVLQRFENAKFTCEYKYDGERAQIHMKDNRDVHIYSRNQEDNTSKYPDVISRIRKSIKQGTESFILDSEAVAWDKQKQEILPFQVLSTRKRKDANEAEIKVQVCIFAFDLLYINGESLVRKTYEERRKLLRAHFDEIPGEFVFVQSRDSDNVDDIAEFLDEAIKSKCEGLMVKTLDIDSTYEIAKRSHNWLKLKKDYLEGVGDTLDLVVIGGYHGKGKRTGNYGGFLLACYDPDNEEFQTICKIGTGFKDEALTQHSAFFKDHILAQPKPYYCYDPVQAPDVWLDAVQVWEVKCADLSISPTHKAGVGIVSPEKGISLRFPRFVRIRDDKNPEDATDASQVAKLYRNQEQVKSQAGNKKADAEEDFY